jgi:hypothetical protein
MVVPNEKENVIIQPANWRTDEMKVWVKTKNRKSFKLKNSLTNCFSSVFAILQFRVT